MDKAPDTARKISVLLADDHTMFRQGLAGILASYGGVEVVGEVQTTQKPYAWLANLTLMWLSCRCRCPSRGPRSHWGACALCHTLPRSSWSPCSRSRTTCAVCWSWG